MSRFPFTQLNQARGAVIGFFLVVAMFDAAFYLTGRFRIWAVGIALEIFMGSVLFLLMWWVAGVKADG